MKPARMMGLAALLAGCGGDATNSAGADAGTACAVGTGQLAYAPLADGDAVPIIHGPQGGYHIWGAFRSTGLDPAGLKLAFTLTLVATGAAVNTVRVIRTLTPVAGEPGWAETFGSYVFVPDPRAIDRQPVRLSVDAQDSAGRTSHDERTIVPQSSDP